MQTPQITLQTLALLRAIYFSSTGHAATYTVTRGDDPAPNGCVAGDCSLREALQAAVVTPAGDPILVVAGPYNVTRGQLKVVVQVTIAGAGSASTRIVSTGAFNLMGVSTLGKLNLGGVEISSQQDALLAVFSAVTLTSAGNTGFKPRRSVVNSAQRRCAISQFLAWPTAWKGSQRDVDTTCGTQTVINDTKDALRS